MIENLIFIGIFLLFLAIGGYICDLSDKIEEEKQKENEKEKRKRALQTENRDFYTTYKIARKEQIKKFLKEDF